MIVPYLVLPRDQLNLLFECPKKAKNLIVSEIKHITNLFSKSETT